MNPRAWLRRLLPFALRVEAQRARRAIRDALDQTGRATRRERPERYPCLVFEWRSPLERRPGQVPPALQAGKLHNLGLICRRLHGLRIAPGEQLSYHQRVGRPSRWRGFRVGLELHDGQPSAGVGGGACQASNLLYWLGANAGLTVLERHRHHLDLFPDHERRVPFGCGATVFYNYRDLRLRNPHAQALLLELRLEEQHLYGAFRSARPLPQTWRIEERDARVVVAGGQRWRENRIYRVALDGAGRAVGEELLAHNRCLVCY